MATIRTIDISLLLARLFLGTAIAAHGGQKLFGWFGGYGFEGSLGYFTDVVGLPYLVAILIILAESLGMVALMAGLFSRILAIAVMLIMVGAISTAHGQFGFFMNWSGTQAGEGFEYHFLVIGLSAVIAISGAGTISLDAILRGRLARSGSPAKFIFQ